MLGSACSEEGSRRAPDKSAVATQFSPLPGVRPTSVRASSSEPGWQRAPFALIQTELSPATLFHCELKHLSFFTGLAGHGLGAPTFAAYGADGGPRIATNSSKLDTSAMNECWVLVWFAGAKGWTNWDSPWAVFLQRRPSAMRLDADGLHLDFPGPAGDAVLMPLYGDYRPPQQGREVPDAGPAPAKKIKTWEWSKFLPRDLLMRVRYWAGATREFPLDCEDSFSADEAQDTVTIRQRIHWHSIADDWRTKHLKFAPVSPPLGLATRDEKSLITISRPAVDLDYATADGPYFGVENADVFDVTFRAVGFTHQVGTAGTHPTATAALARMRDIARQHLPSANHERDDSSTFCMTLHNHHWAAFAQPHSDGTPLLWPAPSWNSYQAPSGTAWSFGHVRPSRKTSPGEVRAFPLTGKARALIYSLPEATK